MEAGSIPARAGETFSKADIVARVWVYPRPCGGNRSWLYASQSAKGLSPPVRGKLYDKKSSMLPLGDYFCKIGGY